MKILFVCLSNTSRSPLAAGILRKKIAERSLEVEVDSAGFEAHLINEPPENIVIQTAAEYNIDISSHRSHLFSQKDFDYFDKIYVMDSTSFRSIMYFARNIEDRRKVDFILNTIDPGKNARVPNPIHFDRETSHKIYELLDRACEVIADDIEKHAG
jgi:protein-tyrosine phosphatase